MQGYEVSTRPECDTISHDGERTSCVRRWLPLQTDVVRADAGGLRPTCRAGSGRLRRRAITIHEGAFGILYACGLFGWRWIWSFRQGDLEIPLVKGFLFWLPGFGLTSQVPAGAMDAAQEGMLSRRGEGMASRRGSKRPRRASGLPVTPIIQGLTTQNVSRTVMTEGMLSMQDEHTQARWRKLVKKQGVTNSLKAAYSEEEMIDSHMRKRGFARRCIEIVCARSRLAEQTEAQMAQSNQNLATENARVLDHHSKFPVLVYRLVSPTDSPPDPADGVDSNILLQESRTSLALCRALLCCACRPLRVPSPPP